MKPNNNVIACLCIICCVLLTVFIFSASRNDSGLRMAALVSSTSIAAALIAIASVILTGKDLSHPDVPPNSSLTQTTKISTPPDPNATNGVDTPSPKS